MKDIVVVNYFLFALMSSCNVDCPVCGLTAAAAQWNKHIGIRPFSKLLTVT